ncbi:MAG TPA: hypothetical protein VGA18_00135, partial [Rhodothermales bacterium]
MLLVIDESESVMKTSGLVVLALALLHCEGGRSSTSLIAQSADDLSLSWGVTDNYVGGPSYFESELTLKNDGALVLLDDWGIYFNFIHMIRS